MNRIRQTSLFAYNDIKPELGKRQQAVYDKIRAFPQIDNLLLSQMLKWPINSVTPRVNELVKLGKVRAVGTHRSTLTGRTVTGWEVISQ